jgi:hypothetical protein
MGEMLEGMTTMGIALKLRGMSGFGEHDGRRRDSRSLGERW